MMMMMMIIIIIIIIITIWSPSPRHDIHSRSSVILELGCTRRLVVNFTPRPQYPRERTLVPIEYEAGRAPQPIWTVTMIQ